MPSSVTPIRNVLISVIIKEVKEYSATYKTTALKALDEGVLHKWFYYVNGQLRARNEPLTLSKRDFFDMICNFIEILSLIKESWEGIPESLNTEIIGGMYLFYKTYKGEYKRKTLVTQLSKVSPSIIIREGKAFSNGGDARFARQILNIYNKNLRTNRLDDKI